MSSWLSNLVSHLHDAAEQVLTIEIDNQLQHDLRINTVRGDALIFPDLFYTLRILRPGERGFLQFRGVVDFLGAIELLFEDASPNIYSINSTDIATRHNDDQHCSTAKENDESMSSNDQFS